MTISAAEAKAFYLDYVLLGAESAYVTSNSSVTATAGASTTPGSGGYPTQSSTQSSSKNGLNVSAIAGGVVAGTVALVAVVLAVLFFARRRAQLQQRPVHILGQQVDAYPSSLVPLTREVGGVARTHTTGIRERPRATSTSESSTILLCLSLHKMPIEPPTSMIVEATGATSPVSRPTPITITYAGEPLSGHTSVSDAVATVSAEADSDSVRLQPSMHKSNVRASTRTPRQDEGRVTTDGHRVEFEVNSDAGTPMSPPPPYTHH